VIWLWVLLTSAGCYLTKLTGLSIKSERLEGERLQRWILMVPPAFFGGLVLAQTVTAGNQLVVDARLAGLAAAAVALLLRAPFLLVLVVAAAVTAAVRAVA